MLRPALQLFAGAMEVKLKKNDHKTGWLELPAPALFRLLEIEIEEYKVAAEYFGPTDAKNELVDIANFCMMLWDRLSLDEQRSDKQPV